MSINAPTCGSGKMLLAAAELLEDCRMGLRLSGTDIELIACKMAYSNRSWLGVLRRTRPEQTHGAAYQIQAEQVKESSFEREGRKITENRQNRILCSE